MKLSLVMSLNTSAKTHNSRSDGVEICYFKIEDSCYVMFLFRNLCVFVYCLASCDLALCAGPMSLTGNAFER